MPFVSEKQEGYMWVHHPDIARRWTREHGSLRSKRKKKRKLRSRRE
jgi:hypothetical protein